MGWFFIRDRAEQADDPCVGGRSRVHSQLIMAGATTMGTQAAVEYVTRQNLLEELATLLAVKALLGLEAV
jgi:hypothetical protein